MLAPAGFRDGRPSGRPSAFCMNTGLQSYFHTGEALVQTAEGALNEVHSMLQRARELAVQYKNGTLGTGDRLAIQSEVNQLKAEIERIGAETEFNGIKLLNASGTVTFQVGAGDSQQITAATV